MSKKFLAIVAVILLIIVIIVCSCSALFMIFVSSVSNAANTSTDKDFQEQTISKGGSDKIAVIDVKGEILDGAASSDFWGNSFAGSDSIIKQLDQAKNDDSVKAIILDINSPGGGVYASDLIYQKIKEVQGAGKPVIALMRDMAASGGYYISAPADKIVASDLTITGSIGVLIQFTSLDGLYEKAGIESKTMTNTGGTFKTTEGLFDNDPNGEEEKIMQKLVDEAYNKFVGVIAEGRGMSVDEVKKLGDGRIYTGNQAKANGLVDELGNFETAVNIAKSEANVNDVTVIRYERTDFWSLLTSAVGSSINPVAKLLQEGNVTPGMHLQYMMK